MDVYLNFFHYLPGTIVLHHTLFLYTACWAGTTRSLAVTAGQRFSTASLIFRLFCPVAATYEIFLYERKYSLSIYFSCFVFWFLMNICVLFSTWFGYYFTSLKRRVRVNSLFPICLSCASRNHFNQLFGGSSQMGLVNLPQFNGELDVASV